MKATVRGAKIASPKLKDTLPMPLSCAARARTSPCWPRHCQAWDRLRATSATAPVLFAAMRRRCAFFQTWTSRCGPRTQIRHVGDILRGMGRKVDSAPHYAEALELYRGNDETAPLDLANTLRGYALLQADHRAFAEAMQLWQQAGRLHAQ